MTAIPWPVVLCPDPNCGHRINSHQWVMEFGVWMCRGLAGQRCYCTQSPEEITRAALVAEPTEAEVEAAAEALVRNRTNGLCGLTARCGLCDCLRGDDEADYYRGDARAALRAARGLA